MELIEIIAAETNRPRKKGKIRVRGQGRAPREVAL